jgi:hypothetical protein
MRRMALVLAVVGVASGGVPGGASGQVEVEADPIAYALNGFSLLDYLGSRVDGFFVGVDGGFTRMSFTAGSGGKEKRNEVGVGLRGGYRLDIGRGGLYLAPWFGVGYTFGGGDIVIGEERFEHKPITIFPTVHIGWRF